MTDDVRARFLGGIAAQLPVDRVKELHLFGAIRQGGAESGVAVVAVEHVEPVEPAAMETPDDDALAESEPGISPFVKTLPARYTVYTARYRLTLKGLDRGKWEMTVTEEADAPLLTVNAVVRGVSRRSGESDETIRLSGDEFRAALPQPAGA